MSELKHAELVAAVAHFARHCWRGRTWIRKNGRPLHIERPLTMGDLDKHVDGSPRVGLAPIVPGTAETRIGLIDFDDHAKNLEWSEMIAYVRPVYDWLRCEGYSPIPVRSSSGHGVHLILLFEKPQDAYSVREMLGQALAAGGLKDGARGVKAGEAERFPKQNEVAADGAGSMFWLPFSSESLLLDEETLEPVGLEEVEDRGADWPNSKPVPALERPAKPERTTSTKLDASLTEIKAMLDAIPNDGGAESPSYDKWFGYVCAVHDATGGSPEGLALVHEFSVRNPKYDADFIDERVWPYLKSDRGGPVKTLRSLAKDAREHGWEENVVDRFEDLGPLEQAADEAQQALLTAAGVPFCALRTANDIDITSILDPNYLIKGWVDKGANAVLFGEWNVGKTFVVFNMAAHIAAGREWFGRRVKQAGVLYLAFEGARGIDKRVAALREQFPDFGWSSLPLAWKVLRWPLTTEKGRDDLQVAIKDFHGRFGAAPGLVIIDPLKDALGGDDGDAELMGKLNMVVLDLIHTYGCCVMRLHHSGHSDKTRSRGHSSLPAAADTEIKVSEGLITATKQRDDGKGELAFRLVVVELGVDQDGDRVTTCVVEPGARTARARRDPTGPIQKIVLDAARELVGLDPDTTVSNVIAAAAAKIPRDDATSKDRRRERVTTALQSLAAFGWLAIADGKVALGEKA